MTTDNKFRTPAFETIMEKSITAMALGDLSGRLIYANPACLSMWGYDSEKEMLGRTITEFYQDRKTVLEIAESLKTSGKWEGELTAKRKDNSTFIVQVRTNVITDEENNSICLAASFNDITGKKRAENALKESDKLVEFYKEYAENIVAHLPLSLLIINRDLEISFANQHFLSKMRLIKDDIVGKGISAALGRDIVDSVSLDKKVMQVIKKERGIISDRFSLKGRTYDYIVAPLKEQFGRRRNAMIIMEDTTERASLEEQLIHAEKLSAVGRFTAAIAHEINNPLSIVVGNIQYLLSNIPDMNLADKKEVENLAGMLKTANAEARRCAEIVTNLLHFAHKGEPAKTELSINGVVKRTLQLLAPQLKASKVQSIIKLEDDLPAVMGNADRLQQVFVNVVLNAQQVMKEGGKLHVSTSLDGNNVAVSFKDTGPGIPKKYIRRIFEPFYTTKAAGKGTGLGLFIVHTIMEDHRGKIEVQSKRGRGATFILKLPAVKKKGWLGF